MPAPRVSVVMTVYNGARLVGESIESVLGQTFADFEFIIVDDGSTDETPAVLATYARRDGRISVHTQPHNLGFREALNQGCRLARASLIARLDADDISLPNRFERQVAFLDAHPDVGVVGSAVQLVDERGVRGIVKSFPADPDLVAWSMLFFNSLAHPAVMLRRALLEQVGFYPAGCQGGTEDYAVFMALSRVTRLANLPGVYLLYRTWAQSMTARSWEAQERDAGRILRESLAAWWQIEVTHEQASLLRGLSRDQYPQSSGELRAIAGLIPTMLDAFCRDSGRGPGVASVRRDAAVRLWLLAALAVRKSPALAAALPFRATTISPASGWFFGIKAAKRLAGR
jgi:hypothetical protein